MPLLPYDSSKLKISSLIVSSDKDLMQLVNEKVEMLDPMKNKKIGIPLRILRNYEKENDISLIEFIQEK